MAAYRQIHITFWQDPFIEGLEPKQKYFYLYLMTNSKTKQCGCYEISMRLMQYETNLSSKEIKSYIKLFVESKKIDYSEENQEFLIINWMKHNSFKSIKVKTCIINELGSIKTQKFIDYVYGIINSEYPIDRLSIDYAKTMQGGPKEEETKEETKEEIKEPVKPEGASKEFIKSWWNKLTSDNSISSINEINEERWRKVNARKLWEKTSKIENAINESSFVKDEKWFSFDWILKESNLLKLLEGNYKDGKSSTGGKICIREGARSEPGKFDAIEKAGIMSNM